MPEDRRRRVLGDALDPELGLLSENVFRGQAAQLADAETRVEQRPDDERLVGVSQAAVSRSASSAVRSSRTYWSGISPPESSASGHERRNPCAFRARGAGSV